MGADSDKKGSRIEEMRAKNVDRILDFQAAEFLAQSSKTFDFDERTSTPSDKITWLPCAPLRV